MEDVVDQLAAVEATAGDRKSRKKQLSRASSSDSYEMYSGGSPKEAAAGDRKSRKKQLSRSSSSDSDEMYSGGSPKEILKLGGIAIAPSGEADTIFIPHVIDKTLILNRSDNSNNNSTLPSAVPDIGGGGAADDGYRKPIEGELELDLQTLYTLPNSHNFYCPSCKSCITKVIILRDAPAPLPPSPAPLPPSPAPLSRVNSRINVLCSNCFSFLDPIGKWIASQFRFGPTKPEIPEPSGTDVTSPVGSPSISRETGIEVEGDGSIVLTIPPVGGDGTSGRKVSGGRSLEIMKSIVYGGLTEAITSLGIVTSAASASTPTENIVALALANLITGLIVITNNLSGLKSNQLKQEPNQSDEANVDPYEEALGDRHHYLLHFTTAILSFLIFGLLPPLVYGFSFRDTDDGDLKLVAVAASSLLCIALLAIAKAYAQKAQKWQDFAKTLVYYVTLGFGASGLSYLAGKEFDMLLEQFGWFKKDPMAPTLLLPNMDFASPTWGSM